MDGGITDRRIGWDEKERIAAENLVLLEEDLLGKRLVFESMPSRAHVQFSNFCNMSCIMCWDGRNPPLKKMLPEVLDRISRQIAPTLSVITPHDGSEPLLVSWEETRQMAEQYSVRLALTTNAQFLDEATFMEAKDLVEQFTLSIDSHVPEIYAKIRVGSKPGDVFENLDRVARLSEEHGIVCIVQAVLLTDNAPMMPETIAYMADHGIHTVNVIGMVDANGHSSYLDPTLHFSADWLRKLKQRCVAEAERARVKLGWQLRGQREWFDFRPAERRIPQVSTKTLLADADERLALLAPGFCRHAREGVRITADGRVKPCPMAEADELQLGNLVDQDFQEIWTSPSARDLRRAHFTWDYPALCKTCRFTDKVGPREWLPFVPRVAGKLGADIDDFVPRLVTEEPAHMSRLDSAPVIRLVGDFPAGHRYVVALALGGSADRIELCEPAPVVCDDAVELPIGEELWGRLDTNLGWWWSVFELGPDERPVARSAKIQRLVRHHAMPRIDGSTIHYPDDGKPIEIYLGGERQLGWTAEQRLPERPEVRVKADIPRRRFADDLPSRLRAAVGELVPEGAEVLVVSKGNDRLLELSDRSSRHFPCYPDGRWAGHPANDDAAIAHLEELRAQGATHLVVPVWARWWLDHYPSFAEHLRGVHRELADVPRVGTIFELAASQVPSGKATDPTTELVTEADRMLGSTGQHHRFWQRFHPGGELDEVFPRFASHAQGYELVDSRDRTFVDWVMGGGPVILGYRHPAVEEAIRAQLEAGPTLSLPHAVQVDVARLLIELVPCAEMVAFGKNGSDAVTAAVRLARAATGRDLILQHGVHGFHDWHAVARRGVQGIPRVLRALVEPFPYNDIEALEALFDQHPEEVAAIVMEPVTGSVPQAGYLEAVRDLAHAHGALLVFDEMVTGFRLANGGAQELYGVTPDLACFGKALSNGMPLSAVAGSRRYMELLPKVAFGMTFRGETLSLAAARAVLQTLRDEPVTGHVAAIGEQVREAFDLACHAHGVRGGLRGHPARLFFFFEDHGLVTGNTLRAAFLRECAWRGVFTNGSFLPTYAHDADAVARTAAAFDGAIRALAQLVQGADAIAARAVEAGFAAAGTSDARCGGNFEVVREQDSGLLLEGWLLSSGLGLDGIEAFSEGGASTAATLGARPDVAAAFPGANAETAGFVIRLPARIHARKGRYDFTLRGRRGNAVVFTCRFVRPAGGRLGPPILGDDGTLCI